MINIDLELERLRVVLENKGIEQEHVNTIVRRAKIDIIASLQDVMDSAVDNAVQSGVQKDSADFINELRPSFGAFQLETASGNTDFSEPPMPMLDKLLSKGAKPMKDGSGVYKVIPVGKPSGRVKTPIASNIFDAQKAIAAERYQSAVAQYAKISPKGSQVMFRTATSKQSRETAWVQPEKPKDFTEDLQQLNSLLADDHDNIVLGIIQNYE
jgi:hypothetical protein